MGFADLKNTIRNLVTSAVADSVVDHVASREREPIISENPPQVHGWRLHRTAGGEPTWSCPPWSGAAQREYERAMTAVCFTLRHELLEHDRAIAEHRKVGEPVVFISTVLPGDLQHLPKSIAEHARELLKAEGWL